MANSLAKLEVLGLERFLDLGLPVPRRVLLLLLLRGRGRARGQAVQHLPDVEFPHGLGGVPPQPGRGDEKLSHEEIPSLPQGYIADATVAGEMSLLENRKPLFRRVWKTD